MERDIDNRYLLRLEIEAFLYDEAALLDEWQLEEWLKLFTANAINRIPPLLEPDRSPSDGLYLVDDDVARLKSRVAQLMGGTAWAEIPRSSTRRLITNVRSTVNGDGTICARANIHIHRTRQGQVMSLYGECRYVIIRLGEQMKISERVIRLTHDNLDQGALSFII